MESRILRISEVLDRIGVSKATLYRMVRRGDFPKQCRLGGGRIAGWHSQDVDAWFAQHRSATTLDE